MVKRYSVYEDHIHHDIDDGEFVHYNDYAALESRMTSIISGVQLELEDERKVRMKAEARVAEMERDVARYRWLRDYGRGFGMSVEMDVGAWIHTYSSSTLDSAIDKAMEALK